MTKSAIACLAFQVTCFIGIVLITGPLAGCSAPTPKGPTEVEVLKARVEALETLCKPLLAPEAQEATKQVVAASQAAQQASQQSTALNTQVAGIKQEADRLTAVLSAAAAQDKITALQQQIAQLQTAVQQAQAAAVAADAKASKIKIANAIYSPLAPKKWCKCSAD